MIATIEGRLQNVLPDAHSVEAMLRAIRHFDDFRNTLPFVAAAYTRTLVHKHERYELVAMQWAPGCASPIHDHAGSRCWVVMLEGSIDVENFDRLDENSARASIVPAERLQLVKGDIDHRLSWRELHRVANTGATSAYTLQLYAPQIAAYRVFDESSGAMRDVPAIYDAVLNP